MHNKVRKVGHKQISIPMTPVGKRRGSSIDQSALVGLNVKANHSQPININQGIMKLENMSDSRQIDANNAVLAALQQEANALQPDQIMENGYNAIEYVESPVVAVHTDQQAKFSDELINEATNVSFVEINGSTVKSNPPLELYFDVLPSSSTNSNAGTSAYIPRQQEHQAPKAQILVRAYSDFLQQSQENHQLHAIQVESPHHPDDETNTEYSIRDMITSGIAQLDDTTIPHTFIEYKKNLKMESPKKMQLHIPQGKQTVMGDVDNCKMINTHTTEMHSEFSNHDSHIQHGSGQQDARHQHYILQPAQQQPRYQVMPKYSLAQTLKSTDYPMNTIGGKVVPANAIVMQNVGNEANAQLGNGRTGKEQDIPYSNESASLFTRNPHFNNENGAFFSRSGRLIRRRPEYVQYVNEENLNHEIVQDSTQEAHLAMDVNINPCLKNKELSDDSEELDDMADGLSFGPADCGSYIDDKTSLPHKKRIQKNYKKSKKTPRDLTCHICGTRAMNMAQFNEHKLSHDSVSGKVYVCEICHASCDTQLKFFTHLKTHYEPNKLYNCALCGGEFNSAQALEQHSTIHSTPQLQCVACQKHFRTQSALDGHMKTSHVESTSNDEVFRCTACFKEYGSQLAIDSHVCPDEHGDGAQLHCPDCYQYFKTSAKLLAHRKAEHKEEMNPTKKVAPKKKKKSVKQPKNGYPCTLCARTFIHKNSLNYHMRRHTGERPHPCDLCGKAFFAASALKVHKRLHSGEKPYKCEDCGKFFRQWGDLKYHASSVHSETRQFQCEFCGKDFKRKYCLVVHRRIHTGEKNYKCEYCQKLFRASSYLQNHIRCHTGERPYPCPDCGKAFRVRSDMKRHRATHTRDTFLNKSLYPTAKAVQASETIVGELKNESTDVVEQRHTPSNEVQILQNDVGEGQLLVAENILDLTDPYPIRIMVAGLPPNHSSQPPPAHRQSQMSCVNMNNMATYTPESPNTNSNSASSISSEGIIITESAQQPVNLNVIPRSLAQPSVSGEHTVSIGGDQYELISTSRGNGRADDNVCVWTGVL